MTPDSVLDAKSTVATAPDLNPSRSRARRAGSSGSLC